MSGSGLTRASSNPSFSCFWVFFVFLFCSQSKVLPTVIRHVCGRTDCRCFSQSNKVSKHTAGHLQFNPILYIRSKISLLLLATIKKKTTEYVGGLFSNCFFLIFSVLDVNCGRIFTPNCQNTWNMAKDLTDQPYHSLFCRRKSWTCFHYIQHRRFQAVGDVSFGAVVSYYVHAT